MIAALYKTNTTACLKKFGIVQFIKGCYFNSTMTPDGNVKKWFGLVRDFKGKSVRFIHNDWEADTTDVDPLYWSTEKAVSKTEKQEDTRFEAYRYFINKTEFTDDEQTLNKNFKILDNGAELTASLAKGTPSFPQLYATDMPGAATYLDNYATNTSVKFQTCIYDIKNVPTVGDPQLPGVSREEGGPIKCLSWDFINVYDHAKGVFESSDTIDPYCESPQASTNRM
jgi:hypothetical protein